jgi:hypothetical protein
MAEMLTSSSNSELLINFKKKNSGNSINIHLILTQVFMSLRAMCVRDFLFEFCAKSEFGVPSISRILAPSALQSGDINLFRQASLDRVNRHALAMEVQG